MKNLSNKLILAGSLTAIISGAGIMLDSLKLEENKITYNTNIKSCEFYKSLGGFLLAVSGGCGLMGYADRRDKNILNH